MSYKDAIAKVWPQIMDVHDGKPPMYATDLYPLELMGIMEEMKKANPTPDWDESTEAENLKLAADEYEAYFRAEAYIHVMGMDL